MTRAYPWHGEGWRLAQSALARGAHALLIAGAPGLAKADFARELAAAYLCASRDARGRACAVCESCHWFAAGTHPDFAVIEPPPDEDEGGRRASAGGAVRKKPIGVDQIRGLSDLLSITAHRDAGKVIIVQPADALNLAASNALLKSLEEPPPGVVFLLVSDRPALLLATVRSRCQSVPIHLRDGDMASRWLMEQGMERPELGLALSGGAPLEAIAISGNPVWARRPELLRELVVNTADPIRIAELFRDLSPAQALSWLQKLTYDLVLARLCARVRYNVDFGADIQRFASRFDPIYLTRLHRRYLLLQRIANHPLNARLFLEQMFIEFSRMRDGDISMDGRT